MTNATATLHAVTFSTEGMPEHSIAFLLAYGLKQKLADAGAGEDDKLAAAQGMFDRLMKGDISRASRGSRDPVEREMFALATDFYHEAIRKAGLTIKIYKSDEANAAKLAAKIDERVASGVDRDLAVKRIADKAAGPTVDLADLGL